jgi:hypothetical protein
MHLKTVLGLGRQSTPSVVTHHDRLPTVLKLPIMNRGRGFAISPGVEASTCGELWAQSRPRHKLPTI